MLTEGQIEKKLYERVGYFYHYMGRKQYLEAALCVDWMHRIAQFIDLPEEKRIELFGNRDEDNPVEGLIREESALKAEEWCVCKGGYDVTRHTYQNVQRLQ